jgi:hypothetical protein
MEEPNSEGCHQRHNNHYAEQEPGYIRRAKLSDPWHIADYIQ